MCVGHENKFAVVIIQVLIPLLLIVLLVISCWKRRWFLSEPGYQNPYKVVCGVFKFAKSHKHPLRRSAFTHSDDYIPSRLDFAKERFGGPFTTEQVENVKTFIRILLVLLAMGPAFALEVPGSYFVAPLFGIHFHHYVGSVKDCKDKIPMEDLLEITGVLVLPSFILFPVCNLILFSLLRKKLVRVFTRIGVGILFCLLGVCVFFSLTSLDMHSKMFQTPIIILSVYFIFLYRAIIGLLLTLSTCTGQFLSHHTFFLELAH